MLKTYRIIPLLFILFVFGLTLITVSPVLAEDSSEFVACQQIKPSGDFRLMKQKKNCFRDVARSFQGQSGNSMQPVAPTDPSGGEVAELNAKIAELEAENARLLAMQTAPADPSGGEVAKLNTEIAGLKTENATLREQQGAPADPFGADFVAAIDTYNDRCDSTIKRVLKGSRDAGQSVKQKFKEVRNMWDWCEEQTN
jgi:hypothetical protein